jgi:processive 1,2-diacylglycerol beta-glucosyltransferase
MLCKVYRYITTHLPRLWYRIYMSTDDMDFSLQRSYVMRKPENDLARLIDEFQPDAVVSTYPIYPYFLDRILSKHKTRPPVFTVITDSIEINASWKKAPNTTWLVTDPYTRDGLIKAGLPAERLVDTGFPVHPQFASMHGVDGEGSVNPFRVLYFPTAKKPHVRRVARALLQASSEVHVTIVLGKNIRLLYTRAKEIQREFPGRVKLIGWTRRVPSLLNTHHLVVGKAGGATVHEAIAAQCPMIVYHLVPGQEEGNLKLLESLGAGKLAENPAQITSIMRDLLMDRGVGWRCMKRRLASYKRNSGSLLASRVILSTISSSKT